MVPETMLIDESASSIAHIHAGTVGTASRSTIPRVGNLTGYLRKLVYNFNESQLSKKTGTYFRKPQKMDEINQSKFGEEKKLDEILANRNSAKNCQNNIRDRLRKLILGCNNREQI